MAEWGFPTGGLVPLLKWGMDLPLVFRCPVKPTCVSFFPTDIGPVTLTADPVVFQRELRELYVQVGCLPSLFFFLFHGRAKECPPPSLPCLPLSS